ncbi:hypothetical protein ILUMI_03756 [Ignelater luminosus]|uniref:AMP-dependent synthetase/ligase domain-containing protein n=1 Tax=Ignelater luminosus TaxID=2038154 RepID=A0A8K0DE24_IGNLU|nr:hypothetical protein ILUMI_03756 [Ignelater luminosus]
MQIDGLTGEVDTYGSVLQRSIRTAITMRSKGITREDIITVCSYNHLNTNIPIIASLLLGVKTASIDPALALSDAVHLLKQVKPKMIFVSENGIKLIEDTIKEIGINSELVVFGKTTKHIEFSEFLNEAPEQEREFIPVEIKDLKETFSIFFSSGTSGLAKGVCLSHRSLISQFPSKVMENAIGSISGCRLVLPKFDTDNFWYLIDKYKVSMLFLPPTLLATICNNEKPENVDGSNLKIVMAGGSTIYKEQFDIIKQLLPTTIVCSDYGQTELGGGCLSFSLREVDYLIKKPTSCGKAQPGYTYKIVDLETEEPLGPNQKGELRVKTDFYMNGYYNIDSSDSWDSDGFLKTGDIFYYDEDYCFYVVDRIKDMLILC